MVCPGQSWSAVPRQAASEPLRQQAAAGVWAGRHAEGIWVLVWVGEGHQRVITRSGWGCKVTKECMFGAMAGARYGQMSSDPSC